MNKKEENTVDLVVSVNVREIKAALKNSSSIREAILEVPCVNPNKLHLNQEIFGVKLAPITLKQGTRVAEEPNTALYASIHRVKVNSLSNAVKEGFVTINASIDVPVQTGSTGKLESIFVDSEADARAVAIALTEVQLDRISEIEDRVAQEKAFLLEQKAEDRY